MVPFRPGGVRGEGGGWGGRGGAGGGGATAVGPASEKLVVPVIEAKNKRKPMEVQEKFC